METVTQVHTLCIESRGESWNCRIGLTAETEYQLPRGMLSAVYRVAI